MTSRTFAKELAAMFSASGMSVMTPHETDSATKFPEELRRLIADDTARFHSVRIRRGMASQLERGYMVSAIAFGYRAERTVLQGVRDVGTVWTVCEAEAVLIREMYARREAGESLRNLAGWLNEAGIAPPGGGRGWYASTVARILSNPIYRGWFLPGRHLAKVATSNRDQACLHRSGFARETLRIVGDVQWFAVQEPNAVVVGSDETRD